MTNEIVEEIPQLLAEAAHLSLRRGELQRAARLVAGLKEIGEDGTASLLEGLLYFARSEFGEAERCYRRGLEQEPDNDLVRTFLAESLIPQRRYREAEELLRNVVGHSRDASAVSFARGLQEGLKQGLFRRV